MVSVIPDQEQFKGAHAWVYKGEEEIDVPEDYAKRVCTLYAQLGARGVSVLHSSGDFGVGGQDPTRPCSSPVNRFRTVFPASCTLCVRLWSRVEPLLNCRIV